MTTETLFLMAAENRHVVNIDIKGAFLHGIMTNEIYMLIHGECVDVLYHGCAMMVT